MYVKSCATSDCRFTRYEDIDFHKAEFAVNKLQKRITDALINNKPQKADVIVHNLIHSFYARALAVRKVTTNKGRKTRGVDNILWETSEERFKAIFDLSLRGYKQKPFRRVFTPKPSGGRRPIDIPTMKDRAMCVLLSLALEPFAKLVADEHSFGFRRGKSTKDAIIRLQEVLYEGSDKFWALKTDVESCFNKISRKWIMENIPLDKRFLSQLTEYSYFQGNKLHQSKQGIPQGTAISPVICNLALDGLEKTITDTIEDVHFIRYADDILLVGKSMEMLMKSVNLINRFLESRGLHLSSKKTQIIGINNGVDFLGWNISKKSDEIIIVPAQSNIDSLYGKIERLAEDSLTEGYWSEERIKTLTNIVKRWLNYHVHIVESSYLSKLLSDISELLRDKYGLFITLNQLTGLFGD